MDFLEVKSSSHQDLVSFFRYKLHFIFINQINTLKTKNIEEWTSRVTFNLKVDGMNTEFHCYKLLLPKFFNIMTGVRITISNTIVSKQKLLYIIQTFHLLPFSSVIHMFNLIFNIALCQKHAYPSITNFLLILAENTFNLEIISGLIQNNHFTIHFYIPRFIYIVF